MAFGQNKIKIDVEVSILEKLVERLEKAVDDLHEETERAETVAKDLKKAAAAANAAARLKLTSGR